jgi:hypothetical protein
MSSGNFGGMNIQEFAEKTFGLTLTIDRPFTFVLNET